MRALVQRVQRSTVSVGRETVGSIKHGLLVYVGVARGDGPPDVNYLVGKIRHLRIFSDPAGRMNLDVGQAGGEVLLISNFTLLADARSGRRPEFTEAAEPDEANALYERLREDLVKSGLRVATGRFRAMMVIDSAGDGPVNILLDSRRQF